MGTPVAILEGLSRITQLALADMTHIAVGTGTNAAEVGDAQLQEETNRVAISQTLRSDNTWQARALFVNSNLPITLTEIAIFMNGSGSPNAGEMLIRVIESFTKGSADLLVVFEGTIKED